MKPTCPACGYDLTGIGIGAAKARCPECGRSFDPARPQELLPPWPSSAVVLSLLCGPPAVVYAMALAAMWVVIAIGATSAGVVAGVVVMGILLAASVLGLVAVPALVVHRLVRRHGDEPGGGIGLRLALSAVAANLIAWLLMLSILGVLV